MTVVSRNQLVSFVAAFVTFEFVVRTSTVSKYFIRDNLRHVHAACAAYRAKVSKRFAFDLGLKCGKSFFHIAETFGNFAEFFPKRQFVKEGQYVL